ncbi:hypothetical protein PENTCL1PPCAC_5945, partial [Pristionchus entomophagus]
LSSTMTASKTTDLPSTDWPIREETSESVKTKDKKRKSLIGRLQDGLRWIRDVFVYFCENHVEVKPGFAPLIEISPSAVSCPDCGVGTAKRFTWKGVFLALICFPCGIFCCLYNTIDVCPECGCEIINATLTERKRWKRNAYQ